MINILQQAGSFPNAKRPPAPQLALRIAALWGHDEEQARKEELSTCKIGAAPPHQAKSEAGLASTMPHDFPAEHCLLKTSSEK